MNTTATENSWFRVPEVWLMIVLLGGVVIGSLMLVATAVRHGDQLHTPVPHSIASPLPPTTATRPSDETTP
jgi:hypothetical protein